MKKSLFILFLSLFFMACGTDVNNLIPGLSTTTTSTPPGGSTDTPGDSTNPPPSGSDATLLAKHSSFEVPVNGTPVSISKIAEGLYTKPDSNYGQSASIDFRINTDKTIDVFWRDSDGKRHLSGISLEDKSLKEEITIPAKANAGGRSLGF